MLEWALLLLSAATLLLAVDMIHPDGAVRLVADARRFLSERFGKKWRLDKHTWTWRRGW